MCQSKKDDAHFKTMEHKPLHDARQAHFLLDNKTHAIYLHCSKGNGFLLKATLTLNQTSRTYYSIFFSLLRHILLNSFLSVTSSVYLYLMFLIITTDFHLSGLGSKVREESMVFDKS